GSERIDRVEDLLEPAAVDRVGDVAAPGELDLRVGDGRRQDGVRLVDVRRANDAGDVEVVLLVIDHHDLGALDEEVAVGEVLFHADGDGAGERAGAGRL